jgi:hypothetical protein
VGEDLVEGSQPEGRYEELIDELVGIAGVTPPAGGSGFGRSGLRFQKKIFAMLVRGRLVLKLPARRVGELIDAGHGVRFDANKGTPMKEWFSLDPGSGQPWQPLAREALEFARRSAGT